MACTIVSFACVTCVFVLIACHVTLSTAKCQCQQRSDEFKYCRADFAINARISAPRPSSNSKFKQYKISIRKVMKESRGFPASGTSAVLQMPVNCKASLRRGETYFITGNFATYSSSSKFKSLKTAQLLQTSACEMVQKFTSGNTKINSWYDATNRPNCRAIKMQTYS